MTKGKLYLKKPMQFYFKFYGLDEAEMKLIEKFQVMEIIKNFPK